MAHPARAQIEADRLAKAKQEEEAVKEKQAFTLEVRSCALRACNIPPSPGFVTDQSRELSTVAHYMHSRDMHALHAYTLLNDAETSADQCGASCACDDRAETEQQLPQNSGGLGCCLATAS